MRKFFKWISQTSKNLRDPQKRKVIYVKTFNLQSWITTRRILPPIILGNLLFTSIYLYKYNEEFSLKLSITRKASKITGRITSLYLPEFLRKPIFLGFSRLYGVKLDEIKEDLLSFKTFNEFFTREVKPRETYPSKTHEIISPADSKILSITEITGNENILIKGQKYKIGHFLTGIKDYEIKGKVLDSMKKRNLENKIYQVIFYLNPGDYHRFHSPTDFYIKKRFHLPGYLYPVKESYVQTHEKVFETNERIAIFGESPHWGFISLVFVGALNVGSISLNFDKDLRTNEVLKAHFPKFALKDFTLKEGNSEDYLLNSDLEEFLEEERYEVKRNSDNEDFPQFKEGILAKKGHELGRFNMGSTVVMFFEGDKDFIFDVKEGQKVKYGDIVGRFKV